MMTKTPAVLEIQKHQSTVQPGYIYCVYDGAVEHTPGAMVVKCGRTSQDPLAYCVQVYGRHMGKVVIALLAQVSDAPFSEALLFRILDKYRVIHRREVFVIESLQIAERAFKDLVLAFNALREHNPHFVAKLLNAPETRVVDTISFVPEKARLVPEKARLVPEKARLVAKKMDSICRRCGYTASQTCNLKNHLKREFPCKVLLEDIDCKTLLVDLSLECKPRERVSTGNWSCAKCLKSFRHQSGLSRHKLGCKNS